MKTVTSTGLSVKAGISHQQSNQSAMLREAHLCGRALVLPDFHLAGYHNYGREIRSRLTEYFDLHVRRGDILHRTAAATTPENIRRVVASLSLEPKALYIATNEPDLRFFEPLTELYDVALRGGFSRIHRTGH